MNILSASNRRSALAALLTVTLSVAACAAGPGAPGGATPTGPAGSSGSTALPADRPSDVPSAPAQVARVSTVEEAIAAVAAEYPEFEGYTLRDPQVIGASRWVEAVPASGPPFHLTFVTGSGDCMSGCIERSMVVFSVSADGSVEKRCEWSNTEGGSGPPC